MELAVAFLASGLVMGVLDSLWLGIVARNFYRSELNAILGTNPRKIPALLFYSVYVVGVVVFVVSPAIEKDSLIHAFGHGALFGFVAYATYDLTNLATLRGFSSKVVVVDLLWGVCITASMALAGYAAATLLF